MFIRPFLNPINISGCIIHRTFRIRKREDMASTEPVHYVPGTHSTAFITTPTIEVAKNLAKSLIDQQLAACINIVPGIVSIYKWEGEVTEDKEALMIIKTRTSKIDDISQFIRHHHPYTVAEVISLPIEGGNPPYLKWLSDSVPID